MSNIKGGLDGCDLNITQLYVQPWIFTSKAYGISLMNIISAYNGICGVPCDCPCDDCGPVLKSALATERVSSKKLAAIRALEAVKEQETVTNTLTTEQIRNSFDAMLKAMGSMQQKIDSLEAKLIELNG